MVFGVMVVHFDLDALYPDQCYYWYSCFSFSWVVGRVGMVDLQLLGRVAGLRAGVREKSVMVAMASSGLCDEMLSVENRLVFL